MSIQPIRLEPAFYEKVWGTTRLSPWYPDAKSKIGEAWFNSHNLPILVKLIFTSDRLSVQVHPDDTYAKTHENSRGKAEMWYILRADPGATIALGFREKITRERLRESAISGEIEHLLNWIPVAPGQAYFTPPGTVHAIGAGIALCEIQQNSDVTYRLYDYGRPRELHLDKAIDVAIPEPHPGAAIPTGRTLAACDYFATELWELSEMIAYQPDAGRFNILIFIEGAGTIGGQEFKQGEAWLVPAGAETFPLSAHGKARMLRTYVP